MKIALLLVFAVLAVAKISLMGDPLKIDDGKSAAMFGGKILLMEITMDDNEAITKMTAEVVDIKGASVVKETTVYTADDGTIVGFDIYNGQFFVFVNDGTYINGAVFDSKLEKTKMSKLYKFKNAESAFYLGQPSNGVFVFNDIDGTDAIVVYVDKDGNKVQTITWFTADDEFTPVTILCFADYATLVYENSDADIFLRSLDKDSKKMFDKDVNTKVNDDDNSSQIVLKDKIVFVWSNDDQSEYYLASWKSKSGAVVTEKVTVPIIGKDETVNTVTFSADFRLTKIVVGIEVTKDDVDIPYVMDLDEKGNLGDRVLVPLETPKSTLTIQDVVGELSVFVVQYSNEDATEMYVRVGSFGISVLAVIVTLLVIVGIIGGCVWCCCCRGKKTSYKKVEEK